MNKTIFIAGKVSGLPTDQVQNKFNRAAQELSEMGYQVITPASLYDRAKSWEEVTRDNIRYMLDCDEIHLLPCWQESRGAQLEREIALRLGMNIVYH